MKDFQERRERLLVEASECDLIANLATDDEKRASFLRLAQAYRDLAQTVAAEIAKRTSS